MFVNPETDFQVVSVPLPIIQRTENSYRGKEKILIRNKEDNYTPTPTVPKEDQIS